MKTLWFACFLLLLVWCCRVLNQKNRGPAVAGVVSQQPKSKAPAIERIDEEDAPGLHNMLKLSRRIYSGSEPHEEDGFRSLAERGIKVIVSVDGAKPNLKLAAKYGLRYVHIPIGYDAIPDKAGKALARLVRDLDGPFYVHCHHGQHRGPAAAAVACIASGAVSAKDAVEILKKAGTSKDYTGLWRDVKNYVPPKAGEKLPKLVAVAKVDSVPAAMAKMDRNFDNLKLCQKAGWQTPKDHPDIVPAQEALLVREGLDEAQRHLGKKHGCEFRQWLDRTEKLARRVEDVLKKSETKLANRRFQALTQSCKQCHRKYRNR